MHYVHACVFYFTGYVLYSLNILEFVELCRWLSEPFLADGDEASSHDLALILSREDSFIDRGIKETLESAHLGHTQSSAIFRVVALQKHDPHSAKCMLELLLYTIKFFIIWLFVRILPYSTCITSDISCQRLTCRCPYSIWCMLDAFL